MALVGIATLLWWATGTAFVELRTSQFQNGTFSGFTFSANLTPWAWLAVFIYFAGLWTILGQTLGMLAFEIRILRATDGRRIGPGRAVIRFVGMLISFIVLFIGVIWVAADGRKQGWHDKIARTVVVWPVADSAPTTDQS